MDPYKRHEENLKELYGIDIAKFPAHLTTINLAARDLSVEENYPRVLCEDFFDVIREKRISILKKEYVEKYRIEGLDLEKLMVKIPLCDAVVMNPPYTRQEEMESLVFPEGYRATLQRLASEEWNGFYVGKRSSIYSYFFFHGGLFVKENGRLGLITSNSWLDADYGKYLQRFFLQNFKIIAIIESKIERWFEDADINTAITILEKCGGKGKKQDRNNNLVKFIQFKKTLNQFIPPTPLAKNAKERQKYEEKRWNAVKKLVKAAIERKEYYEDGSFRVFAKKQGELWEEGYDKEKNAYVGSKWGKYIRAPEIFFTVLDKGRKLFIVLKQIANVRRGFTTGADSFFYLTEEQIKKEGIEKRFWTHKKNSDVVLNYVIKTPRESRSITIDLNDLKFRVLLVHEGRENLKGTMILKYIQRGEGQGFDTRPTCASRERWFDLGRRHPRTVLWQRLHFGRHIVFHNKSQVFADDGFFEISPFDGELTSILCGLLNSTVYALIKELFGSVGLGQGSLYTSEIDLLAIPIIDPRKLNKTVKDGIESAFSRLVQRSIGSVFDEIGSSSAENVSLDKVKPDRRDLDKIVMGEVLRLSNDEQLEVYKAIIDLVKARIEKAKSVRKRKKKIKGINVDALVEDIFEEVGKGRLMKFPDDYIEGFECREILVPEGEAEVGQDLYGFYVKIDGQEIRCKSPYEARYIQYAVLNGKTTVKIFKDEKLIREAVREYASLLREVKKRINDYLESTIPDRKLRKRIKDEVWKKLTSQK